jgi:hypothetical protein
MLRGNAGGPSQAAVEAKSRLSKSLEGPFRACATIASIEARCPDWEVRGAALANRWCGYCRLYPIERRTSRQNDSCRRPGRSAERHVGRARGRQAHLSPGGLGYAANRLVWGIPIG